MNRKFKNIVGVRFRRLVVEKLLYVNDKKQCVWLCRCDCGNVKKVTTRGLTSKHTQSCGCLQREGTKIIHGATGTRLYRIWKGIKSRTNPLCADQYPGYSGRGITMCERWRSSFENFYQDMIPGYKNGLSIDRINNNGNYEPSNCRWATPTEQHRNRRISKVFEINGEIKCLPEWCRIYGINSSTVRHRLAKGMDLIPALTEKPQPKPKNNFNIRWNGL